MEEGSCAGCVAQGGASAGGQDPTVHAMLCGDGACTGGTRDQPVVAEHAAMVPLRGLVDDDER